jgi:hypothetical protein
MDPLYGTPGGDGFTFDLGALALDDDGASGWALGGPAGMIGRITLASADACSVDLVPITPPVERGSRIAVDGQHRLHVVSTTANAPVRIHDATGALVSTYFHPASATFPVAREVARCAGGVCLVASTTKLDGLFYATDDGVVRSSWPRTVSSHYERLAAEPSGPVFMLSLASELILQIAPTPAP